MVEFYKTDCAVILSQIKQDEKLLNLKRRWLMGLSTSNSKKKQFKEPKFFKYKTLPESFLREDDVFYERIKSRIEEAFGARNLRGSHVSEHSDESFDAFKIKGSFLSSLDAFTNNGLYNIASVLTGCPRSFEKTRRKMKQVIKASFPSLLDGKNHTCQQKETIKRLYRALDDPQNFRTESMKSVTPKFQVHCAAVTDMLEGLKKLPYPALVAMDRKLRCLKSVPQLRAGGQETSHECLPDRVSKIAKEMLSNLEKGGELPEPLAKVADLCVKLTRGCQNTSAACFFQSSPEIVSLQNEIVKAIFILESKIIRFPKLETLKPILDANVEITKRSLRGAIRKMLTEFLFECSDMDTVPQSLLETLALINKDSRSMPQGQEVIEEEVECILSVSAQMKQIFWDSFPDYEFDEQFDDAYMEELEESDDGSCIANSDDGSDRQEENEDTESCMSCSVNSVERDENKSNIKVDPEYITSNEKGSRDINHVNSVSKLHVSTNEKCFTPFSLPSREINDYSIERDDVKQNIRVDLENASLCFSSDRLGSVMYVHNKSRLCRNQYLTAQEACDETSLVAYDLIGHLLEKFMKEQDMDLDQSNSLYLRGVSPIQEDTQEKKQKRPKQDAEDSFTQIINKLMPSLPKSAIERFEELMATNKNPYVFLDDF